MRQSCSFPLGASGLDYTCPALHSCGSIVWHKITSHDPKPDSETENVFYRVLGRRVISAWKKAMALNKPIVFLHPVSQVDSPVRIFSRVCCIFYEY